MRRVKKHVDTKLESGPGLPEHMDKLLHSESSTSKHKGDNFTNELKSIVEKNLIQSRNQLGMVTDSQISELSMSLNLDEYKFDDETPQLLDPKGKNQEITLDVTALDRYNEDIRHYRRLIVEQCRFLPTTGIIPSMHLHKISSAIIHLCRSAYYGTLKAQTLAAGALPLLVWILNRTNLSSMLQFIVLRSLSELLHESVLLKREFVQSAGVKVIVRFLRHFPDWPDESQMAVYALTMACIGSAEVIQEARSQQDMEDIVAELSFEYYWFDWPVNYGKILQGILYGPYSLTSAANFFQHL